MGKKCRVDRVKISLGGASNRKFPSKASILLNEIVTGRVLDYGCGYGIDARTFGWESYDPYYNDTELEGKFDSIVCINVLSAVSSQIRKEIIENIRELLRNDKSIAYLAVPRNLPLKGKFSGYARRPQNYVILTLDTIYDDRKYTIYKFMKNSKYIDKTKNLGE